MASGETLFVLTPEGWTPPDANPAQFDSNIDASTPATYFSGLDFDGAADEHADWHLIMPAHYADGGLTFQYSYKTTGTDGNIIEFEFRCVTLASGTDLTTDLGIDTATEVAIQHDPAAGSNLIYYSTTGNLSHANAGSPSPGDQIIIRATRDTSAVSNTDDAMLLSIYVTET
jgi:hypothetical protein